jgi:hypothetical protein
MIRRWTPEERSEAYKAVLERKKLAVLEAKPENKKATSLFFDSILRWGFPDCMETKKTDSSFNKNGKVYSL